ncbi:hypothetical protein FOZ60_003500 [Perkinsus olseni]|uniref:Uncharacterized protein n=1 Tax=Perkinsus olseni TaxID=32597 RepID=A0A7J6NW51_PEROL|nr:hypothetical protein FOZ60_003500 [Perkinsus olseni]
MRHRRQHLRCLAIALQYLLVFPLSLFPPPVDQLVSTLRKRILVRRSDLDWPPRAVTPRPDVCDSSLHGPTCSIIDGPQSGLAVLHHGGVRLGELLPESLLDSSDDADELRARVNRLLRRLNHSEPVSRDAEAVAFHLSLQTSTFTQMPEGVNIHYDDRWSIEVGRRPILGPSDTAGRITFTKNVTITTLVVESPSPVVVQGLSAQRVQWEGHARLSPIQSRIDVVAQSLLVGITRSNLEVPADATAVDEIRIISLSPVTLFTIEGRASVNEPWHSHHRSVVLEPKSRRKHRNAWLCVVVGSADFVDMHYVAEHGLKWRRAPSARDVDLTRGVFTNDLYSEIATTARPTPSLFKLSQHVSRVLVSSWGKAYANSEDSIIEAALASTTEDAAVVEYLRWAALPRGERVVVADSELNREELAVRKDMKEILEMVRARFHKGPTKKPKAKAAVVSVDLSGDDIDTSRISAAVKTAFELVADGSHAAAPTQTDGEGVSDKKSSIAESRYIVHSEHGEHVISHEDLLDVVESLLERVTGDGGDVEEAKVESFGDSPPYPQAEDPALTSEGSPAPEERMPGSQSSSESPT